MHRRIGHALVSPAPHGWHVVAEGGSGRVEGLVRVHPVLTWMQQRRAVEERLRSWHLVPAASGSWTRQPDGTWSVALTEESVAA